MADKGKNLEKDYHISLIPAIEKQERQLRQELQQAGDEAENRIVQVQERMQEQFAQAQQDLSGLTEQMRNNKLKQAHNQAKQLYDSSEKHRDALLEQIRMKMPGAVQSLVDAVTAMGDR